VKVMKPKEEGNDRLEINESLMSQLLWVFEPFKQDLKVVEKLNPCNPLEIFTPRLGRAGRAIDTS